MAANISAAVQFCVSFYVLATGDDLGRFSALGIVDAAMVAALGYWVHRSSRIAIVALLILTVAGRGYQYWVTGQIGSLAGLAIFGYFYAMGAVAIFENHQETRIEA